MALPSKSGRLVMDQPKNAAGQDLGLTALEAIRGRRQLRPLHCPLAEIGTARDAPRDGGDYDPDDLLDRAPSVRPGFQELRIDVEIDAALDSQQKRVFLELIELPCPLANNLTHGTRLLNRLVNTQA